MPATTTTANLTEAAVSHFDQNIPHEWEVRQHAGEALIVRDVPEGTAECYTIAGTTTNPRVMATADALMYEGSIVEPVYDHDIRSVVLVHSWAGRKDRFFVREFVDTPVVLLEKCPRTSIEAVAQNASND